MTIFVTMIVKFNIMIMLVLLLVLLLVYYYYIFSIISIFQHYYQCY